MSKNKIYIITKNKYDGHCRTIGFIRDLGKNIYYGYKPTNGFFSLCSL